MGDTLQALKSIKFQASNGAGKKRSSSLPDYSKHHKRRPPFSCGKPGFFGTWLPVCRKRTIRRCLHYFPRVGGWLFQSERRFWKGIQGGKAGHDTTEPA